MIIMKTLENPRGFGEVFEGEIMIASAHYGLMVRQEINIIETLGGTKELEGLKSVSGAMLANGEISGFVGKERLTLHLVDGRKIDFFATNVDVINKIVDITATGGFY